MASNASGRAFRGQPSQSLDQQIKRYVGLSVIVSFEGLTVTDEVRSLLKDYYVGSVILGPANFHDAVQTARLTSDLQAIAQAAEHAQPLLLGVEQQGGLVGHSFRFAMQDTIDRTTLQPIRWCNQFACCDQNQWINALQRRFDPFQPGTSGSITNYTLKHTLAAIKDSQECEYLTRTTGLAVAA